MYSHKTPYDDLLRDILNTGTPATYGKGDCIELQGATLVLDKFNAQTVADRVPDHIQAALDSEMHLYLAGITDIAEYTKRGIKWWEKYDSDFDLTNSYPTFYPAFQRIKNEFLKKGGPKPSRNYMLHLGNEDSHRSIQAPCIHAIQFQVTPNEGLHIIVNQRSCDANIGLPADIYHMLLLAEMLETNLERLTFQFGNVHIYASNIFKTYHYLMGKYHTKFTLNL